MERIIEKMAIKIANLEIQNAQLQVENEELKEKLNNESENDENVEK